MGNIATCAACTDPTTARRGIVNVQTSQLELSDLEEDAFGISSISLEYQITLKNLPTFTTDLSGKFAIVFKVQYKNQIFKWTQAYKKGATTIESKPMALNYEVGVTQSMKISVYTFSSIKDAIDITDKKPFGYSTFNLNQLLISKNGTKHNLMKIVSNLPSSRKSSKTTGEEENKEIRSHQGSSDMSGEEVPIILQIKEKKDDELFQFHFQLGLVAPKLKKGTLSFSIHQMIGQNKKFLYHSESQPRPDVLISQATGMMLAKKKTKIKMYPPSSLMFDNVTLTSDQFEGGFQKSKTIFIEFFHHPITQEIKGKSCGHQIYSLETLLSTPTESILPFEKGKQRLGKVKLIRRSLENVFTFVDLLWDNVRLIPTVCIDYSLANLTFDNEKCVHHLSREKMNPYVELIKMIEKVSRPFHRLFMGFGFGCKLIPKKSETSNCFVLPPKNFWNPYFENAEELVNGYREALKRVEISLPVNLKGIISKCKDIGRSEMKKVKVENYYVVYVLTSGVIDDFEEAWPEMLKCVDLPISFVFLKVCNIQMKEVNDLIEFKKKVHERLEKGQRRFISVIECPKVLNSEKSNTEFACFAIKLFVSIPPQMLYFFKQYRNKSNTQTPYLLEEQEEQDAKNQELKDQLEQEEVKIQHMGNLVNGATANPANPNAVEEPPDSQNSPEIEKILQIDYFTQLKESFIKTLQESNDFSEEEIEALFQKTVLEEDLYYASLLLKQLPKA